RINRHLGAYVAVRAERALGEARAAERAVMAGAPLGPLHGVPISIKDNLWTAGERVSYGSRLLSDFVAQEDAPSVGRLRAAGAIFVGRTNLPGVAGGGPTGNRPLREARKPPGLSQTPGGAPPRGGARAGGRRAAPAR